MCVCVCVCVCVCACGVCVVCVCVCGEREKGGGGWRNWPNTCSPLMHTATVVIHSSIDIYHCTQNFAISCTVIVIQLTKNENMKINFSKESKDS